MDAAVIGVEALPPSQAGGEPRVENCRGVGGKPYGGSAVQGQGASTVRRR